MSPPDYGMAYTERAEIYDLVRDAKDHRLRDRLRRPPQLLGGLRDLGTAARQVRAGRLELRRRLALERRAPWKPTSTIFPKTDPLRAAVPRRSAGWREARLDAQHAAEARRPLVP